MHAFARRRRCGAGHADPDEASPKGAGATEVIQHETTNAVEVIRLRIGGPARLGTRQPRSRPTWRWLEVREWTGYYPRRGLRRLMPQGSRWPVRRMGRVWHGCRPAARWMRGRLFALGVLLSTLRDDGEFA